MLSDLITELLVINILILRGINQEAR